MLDILFVTDFVCPFCIVAKAALMEAIQETGIEAKIRLQPMELTEEPKERVDTYHDEVRKSHYTVLFEPAKALGLDAKFPPKVIPRPYTRLAWEGWFYAKEKGVGQEYSDLMYHSYFIDEKDIGDIEVLADLAARIGLDPMEYKKALADGTYYQAERDASSYSRSVLEVKGIPTFFINGKRVKMSAYTKEEAIQILTGAAGETPEDDASGCGPEGCSLSAHRMQAEAEDFSGCGPEGCSLSAHRMQAKAENVSGCGSDGCSLRTPAP